MTWNSTHFYEGTDFEEFSILKPHPCFNIFNKKNQKERNLEKVNAWWITKNGMLLFSKTSNLMCIYEKEICLIFKVIFFLLPNNKVILDSHSITLDFVGICVHFTYSFWAGSCFQLGNRAPFFQIRANVVSCEFSWNSNRIKLK